MTAWAVVPAGGRGERFSPNADKLLADLQGQPVLYRTLEALLRSDRLQGVVIAVAPERKVAYQAALAGLASHHKPILFTAGGATRRDSVYQGLLATPESASVIVVHDAARPLITPELINTAVDRVMAGALGALVGVPVRDTLKRVGTEADAPTDAPVVTETVNRQSLWRAQTPQVFRREALLAAHQAVSPDAAVTDDAQLLELAGHRGVVTVLGSERNLKITTLEDLALAAAWLVLGNSSSETP